MFRAKTPGEFVEALSQPHETIMFVPDFLSARVLEKVVGSLRSNLCLEKLDLSRSGLSTKSLTLLATALEGNRYLTHLQLSRNSITDDGVAPLAKSLKRNESLNELYLANNEITSAGAEMLADMLTSNIGLTKLVLNANWITQDGALAIVNSLVRNTSLEELQLYLNRIEGDGSGLVEALKRGTFLKKLYLSGNALNLSAVSEVQQILARNNAVEESRLVHNLKADSTERLGMSKLMLIGEGEVGKTATVRSLLGMDFTPRWDSTPGIELTSTTIANNNRWIKDERVKQASSMLYHTVSRIMHRKPKSSKRRGKSGKRERKAKKRPESQSSGSSHHSGSVSRSSQSTKSRDQKKLLRSQEKPLVVSQPRANNESVEAEIAGIKKLDLELLVRAKAEKPNIRLQIWDYGGQTVFHTLHHLFLTRYGVYLVIFNSKNMVKDPENSVSTLGKWLHSIKLHAPDAPIILVGTFLDKLSNEKGSIESIMEAVSGTLMKDFPQIENVAPHGFVPISNKTNKNVIELRAAVDTIVKKQRFVRIKVPVRWLLGLNSLLETKKAWVRMAEAEETLAEFGVTSHDEVDRFFSFFHELGTLLYFGHSVSLKEIITIHPQWVVDAICSVIRDPDLHKFDAKVLKQIGLVEDAKLLFEQGVSTRDLLEWLWKDREVEFLIELMQNLLLMNRLDTSSMGESYLIPAMIKSLGEPSLEGEQLIFRFEFLHYGVFERLVCLCVDYGRLLGDAKEPTVKQNYVQITWNENSSAHVVKREHEIHLVVNPKEHAASFAKAVVSMLSKIKRDVMGELFAWDTYVLSGGELLSYDDAKKDPQSVWFVQTQGLDTAIFRTEAFAQL